MKKWLACLKDQRGTAFPLVIAVTLACLLILCGIMEFFRLSLIASGVKEALQDAVVVVVSEETGQISIAVNGILTRNYTRETLVSALQTLTLPESSGEKKTGLFSRRRGKKE